MPTATEKQGAATSYQEFISSLELYTIGLSESSCEINRTTYWENEEKRITYKLASKLLGEIHQKHFDVRSSITMNVSGEKSTSHFVRIVATFDLHFHGESITKEFIDKFCESEIRLIVWPYFREYVSNTTARMHIPPVILPLPTKGEGAK